MCVVIKFDLEQIPSMIAFSQHTLIQCTSLCFCSHKSRDRLTDLVAEHLDHLHYLNDILSLDIEHLNNVLTDYLLNRLYIPLYVKSLTPDDPVQVGGVTLRSVSLYFDCWDFPYTSASCNIIYGVLPPKCVLTILTAKIWKPHILLQNPLFSCSVMFSIF